MCGQTYNTPYPARVLLLHLLSAVCRGQVISVAHNSTVLPCHFGFVRGPEDLLVIWEKEERNGKKVQVYKAKNGQSDLSKQDPYFAGRTELSGDITKGNLDLSLTVVTMYDDGTYYCRAANKINHGDNKVQLSVRAPPSEKIEKAAEDDVTLVPKYFGDPNEITWKMGSRKIVEMEMKKFGSSPPHFYQLADRAHLDPKGSLTIRSLTKEDSGLYKSEVLVIDIIQETEIFLSVIDRVSKPVIVDLSTSKMINLLCNSSSSDVAYKWQVKQSRDPVSQEKQYIAPKPEEVVDLICTVSNNVSEDSTTINIPKSTKSIELPLLIALSSVVVMPLIILVALLYRKCKPKAARREEEVHRVFLPTDACDVNPALPTPLPSAECQEEMEVTTESDEP